MTDFIFTSKFQASRIAVQSSAPVAVDPWQVLRHMYESEISGGLESDWDEGFKVWIGNSGWKIEAEKWFGPDEFGRIAPWLDSQVRTLWPDSAYARRYPALSSPTDESEAASAS